MVMGILGVTCLWIIAGIPAIILGFMAQREIKKSAGRIKGSGMAIAGIVLGFISLLFAVIPLMMLVIAVPNFLEAQVRSKVYRAKADMRSLATALDSYYIDCSYYPAWAEYEKSANGSMPSDSDAFLMPSFRVWAEPREVKTFMMLTTPVAYITQFPPDPFADVPGATYCYYSDNSGWILVSPGPDKQFDIDPFEDYVSTVQQPSSLLLEKLYDPTNGVASRGDIFRVK